MKKIAIIGSGISGLTCAYHLSRYYDITVYEKEDYIGGHTHTISIEKNGEQAAIDTGFIVFNDRTYPNFMKLMKEIEVPFHPTEMSFSVKNKAANLEYNGNNLNTLFAQRSNLGKPQFWRMIFDIVRFNRDVRKEKDHETGETIGQFLQAKRYSSMFKENYLLPMISAIWSMGLESCLDFPLQFFARFFNNHGLLDLTNRPQWYTIAGGSSSYIAPLTAAFRERIRLLSPVHTMRRVESGVAVNSNSKDEVYDEVILACHANQALKLLSAPSAAEQKLLGTFKSSDNDVVVHTDTTILPERKNAWASWNYQMIEGAEQRSTLTYNMNILQNLDKKNVYLVSLNQTIKKEHILARFRYSHPVYDAAAFAAQDKWETISGTDRIHFCGAYWYNGFHEDGVKSGLRVCEKLGAAL